MEHIEDFRYISDIWSFQCFENEVYLGVKIMSEKDNEPDINCTLVFSTMEILKSGISDKEYLKEQLNKHIVKL